MARRDQIRTAAVIAFAQGIATGVLVAAAVYGLAVALESWRRR